MTFERLQQKANNVRFGARLAQRWRPGTRRVVLWVIGGIVLIAGGGAAAAAAGLIPGERYWLGGLILTVVLWSVWFAFFAYITSQQFRDLKSDWPLTFELASVLVHTHGNDLTKEFFDTRYGVLILNRLGVSTDVLRELRTDSQPVTRIESNDETLYGIDQYAAALYTADTGLSSLLFEAGITEQMFYGAAAFVQKQERLWRRSYRWWSWQQLRRTRPIGESWAYGEITTLRDYSHEPRSVHGPAGSTQAYVAQTLEQLERVLSRDEKANALVLAEPGSGIRDLFMTLSSRLQSGEAGEQLSDYHIYILERERIMADVENGSELEQLLMTIFSEATEAGNVILVMQAFDQFFAEAERYDINLTSLVAQFTDAPSLHIVGTLTPGAYHGTIEQKSSLVRYFETIPFEVPGREAYITGLHYTILHYESRYNVLFTYPALLDLVEGAENLFTDRSLPDAASMLLEDLGARASQRDTKIITTKMVNNLLEEKTGVPTGEVGEEEQSTLQNLESLLHERIVGQDAAVETISNALRRARSGIQEGARPIGVFLFLGPTGVGKTETAKALADVFFDGRDDITRLDMSEFSGVGALGRLIGDTTTNETGQLPVKVKENPYSVLLLDEFEKTTDDVQNLFLRIFDEGVFHDAFGNEVNLRNMIIIATSNAGAARIQDMMSKDEDLTTEKDTFINDLIQDNVFAPELLNRFDDIVLFHPLSEEQIEAITEHKLDALVERLHDKGYDLQISDELISYVAQQGYDTRFGAREIERVVRDTVEQAVSDKIVTEGVSKGETVHVTRDDLRSGESS